MKLYNIFFKPLFRNQLQSFSSGLRLLNENVETCLEQVEPVLEKKSDENPQRKILKLALVGRPNVGKSTLINKMLNVNVCDVSTKTHTTLSTLRTSLIRDDTQIVLVDTPGVVTKKEFKRFNLIKSFEKWKEHFFTTVDLLGVIVEPPGILGSHWIHNSLLKLLSEVPESVDKILIVNKMDLMADKREEIIQKVNFLNSQKNKVSEENVTGGTKKFSKIFFMSALDGEGVTEFLDYLFLQAKKGRWEFEKGDIFKKPLHIVIENLLRAQVMTYLPYEIPYKCSYEVEYLREKEMGQLFCVARIICSKKKHLAFLIHPKRKKICLKTVAQNLESDLYFLLRKEVRLRIVVTCK